MGLKEVRDTAMGKGLRYPYEALHDHTDYLLINIVDYTKIGDDSEKIKAEREVDVVNEYGRKTGTKIEKIKVPGVIRNAGRLNNKNVKSAYGSIILPIPSNIQDGNSVKYGDSSLDGITASVAEYAIGVMAAGGAEDPIKTIQSLTANTINKVGGMTPDLINVFTKTLAAQAANLTGISPITREQLLARESGGILNPNTELLFSGVSLRSFKFSFKMTPRNEKEAIQIKSIIRTLKINMAAKTTRGGNESAGGNFLSTPNVFNLTYMSGDSPHPFLHSFKTCALTDMSVNYTGDGIYATYGGKEKTPVSMVMDLTFKELEAIYDEDYEDSITGVGY